MNVKAYLFIIIFLLFLGGQGCGSSGESMQKGGVPTVVLSSDLQALQGTWDSICYASKNSQYSYSSALTVKRDQFEVLNQIYSSTNCNSAQSELEFSLVGDLKIKKIKEKEEQKFIQLNFNQIFMTPKKKLGLFLFSLSTADNAKDAKQKFQDWDLNQKRDITHIKNHFFYDLKNIDTPYTLEEEKLYLGSPTFMPQNEKPVDVNQMQDEIVRVHPLRKRN